MILIPACSRLFLSSSRRVKVINAMVQKRKLKLVRIPAPVTALLIKTPRVIMQRANAIISVTAVFLFDSIELCGGIKLNQQVLS